MCISGLWFHCLTFGLFLILFKVSIFLLRSYEPPVLVCAMNELLDLITRGSSTLPTIIAPFFVAASKLKFNNRSLEANNRKASLHYVQVATETETSRLFASRIEKPPLSMQIHYEPLSCLLHLARVKRLPTAILIGQRSNSLTHKALDEELQVILLSNFVSVYACFSLVAFSWITSLCCCCHHRWSMKQGSSWLVGQDCLSQETESSGAHQRHQKKKKVRGVLFMANLHRSGLFHGPTLLQSLLGPALNFPIVVVPFC